jgi:hypothetical protein
MSGGLARSHRGTVWLARAGGFADMNTVRELPVTSVGCCLDTSPEAFGELRDSSLCSEDGEVLRARMDEDGYLYLRGYFKREAIMEVRQELVTRMLKFQMLEPDTDPMDAIARVKPLENAPSPGNNDFAKDNPILDRFLYRGRTMDFYRRFFGEEVLHFDYTWMRMMARGKGTQPHCDVVYMGRGTREKLMTAWIPMGDAPRHVGGLMILEGSHLQHERLRNYLDRDMAAYCSNSPDAAKIEEGFRNGKDLRSAKWKEGYLSKNPASLREKLGGRWLTADFEAGDLLTFTMHTVHGSVDNRSDRYRISTDSRYQPASLPVDERFIGEKAWVQNYSTTMRGRIC